LIELLIPMVGRMPQWEQDWLLEAVSYPPPKVGRERLVHLLRARTSELSEPVRQRLSSWNFA
jgi:hypothetical protein